MCRNSRATPTADRKLCSASRGNRCRHRGLAHWATGLSQQHWRTIGNHANPNTHRTLRNADGKYPGNGRYDQDKGYILRAYFSYNVFDWLQVGCAGNWTDGQPFVFYSTELRTDANGNNNVAVTPRCSRGTNPTDGNFGCRESAIFNFDLHARVNWQMAGCNMSLYAQCYNIWDFGNVLNEYCFPEPYTEGRGPNMCLTIPRGLIVSLKICPKK